MTDSTDFSLGDYTVTPTQETGRSSALSPWAGEYVTDMLGRGRAAADQPYTAYTGPLTAGASDLQSTAFTGLAGLTTPTDMGTYTPMSFTANLETPYDVADPFNEEKTRTISTVAEQYMNPYLAASLRPQLDELTRRATMQRLGNTKRLADAGAYGGSRQAIMDAELDRNLLRSQSDVLDRGYASAYDRGIAQFNKEQDAQRIAQDFTNRYGFDVLGEQQAAGAAQRGITSEGIAADYKQFLAERDYPLKTAQYMQSLLQSMPIAAEQAQYSVTDPIQAGIAGGAGGAGIIGNLFDIIFGTGGDNKKKDTTPPSPPSPSG
jgi:hypothetical protein